MKTLLRLHGIGNIRVSAVIMKRLLSVSSFEPRVDINANHTPQVHMLVKVAHVALRYTSPSILIRKWVKQK